MSRYFQASTANPTGHRPWNFSMQQKPGLGRLRGLGDDEAPASDVSAAQSKANQLAAQLTAINQNIVAQQNLIQQLANAGVDVSMEGAAILQARNTFESAVAQFTLAYRALFGTTPPGLSGMGRVGRLGIPAATIAWILGVLAIVAAAIYEINKILNNNAASIAVKQTQATTAAAATQQAIAIQNQASAACAAGDVSCASLTALAQQASGNIQPAPPGVSTDWTTWLQNNALMIGLVFAGVIIVPKILKKI
jgi:hypothetical protein